MRKFTCLTILMIYGISLFSQDCDETFSGEGTFYGYGGGGNCSFADPTSPVYTGAMNESQYDTAVTCGACVEVTGENGSLIISIEDRCPECQYGDIDLSEEAFPLIADKVDGRVPITWKFVACPVSGAVKLYFKEGSSQYWTAVQVRNHKYPIAKLEYEVNGQWVEVERKMYNYFVVESGMGPGPFNFRITDMYGSIIEEEDIPLVVTTEIDGQNQFPDCSKSSTDVPVAGITLSPSSVSLSVGGTAQLTATLSPTNASNQAVSWSSSDTAVATVSSSGLATGVQEGSATITATSDDGSYTATSEITVTESSEELPCDNPTSIELPFTQEGQGEFCFVTSENYAYINSWDMDKIEINGVDYTNKWSDALPETVNGNYYIYYLSTKDWSHMELSTTKSANAISEAKATGTESNVTIIPNPVTDYFKIELPEAINGEAVLKIIDNAGRIIKTTTIYGTDEEIDMSGIQEGVYNVVVSTEGQVYRKSFIKK